MQKNNTLNFNCLSCKHPVIFSVFDLNDHSHLSCTSCSKTYAFTDPILIRQMKKFEALCRQIHESEEILGDANVGVNVGEHNVKVPYKLLLTRLSSSLDLNFSGQKVSIFFRIEPAKDIKILRSLHE